MFHIFLHFAVPLLVSIVFYNPSPSLFDQKRRNSLTGFGNKNQWLKVYAIMMLTMLVDLDHLLATPIYDALRCSIGFHPLHQWPALVLYCIACFFPKTRVIGIGLLLHMLLDGIDCL